MMESGEKKQYKLNLQREVYSLRTLSLVRGYKSECAVTGLMAQWLNHHNVIARICPHISPLRLQQSYSPIPYGPKTPTTSTKQEHSRVYHSTPDVLSPSPPGLSLSSFFLPPFPLPLQPPPATTEGDILFLFSLPLPLLSSLSWWNKRIS